jgi:hypothetical protein
MKADGTVANMEVPVEILQDSANLNDAQAKITDWLAVNGMCWMFFGEQDMVIAEIRTEYTRQALTGATDLGLYGKYDHKLTAEGLHILSQTDFNTLAHSEDVGVVRSSYLGDAVQAPALQNGQNVWHKVGVNLSDVYTSPLKGKYAVIRSKKHNYIEYLIRGFALKVWIAPIRDYAATIAIQWLVGNLEVAAQFKSERLTASRVRKNVIKPAGYKSWKATEANRKASKATVLPDELWIENLSGGSMDLRELTEPTMLQLYLGGVPVQKMEFIPDNDTRILTFVDMLQNEPNFVAELIG